MKTFHKWLEALHAYDSPDDPDTKFQPIRKGDQLRVFHGFNSLDDAVRAASKGLSGRYRADRRYSYESDNNPYGVFVTLSLKKAQEFVSPVQDQAIMEFTARTEDLEAPVWPGGGYTVQGGYAQYFGHGREGRRKRMDRRKAAEKEAEDFVRTRPHLKHVADSDSKYLARMLTYSEEYQALFVGDLSPSQIDAFWVRPKGAAYNAPLERLTPEQFLDRYKNHKVDHPNPHDSAGPRWTAFQPGDEFDPERFIDGLMATVLRTKSREDALKSLGNLWRFTGTSESGRMASFVSQFKNYLWPRQYKGAFLWMKRQFGRGEGK